MLGTAPPDRGIIARASVSPHTMTDASRQDEWNPGRRRDASRPRTDRRRLGWREFRHNYRGFVSTLTLAVVLFLALDAWLVHALPALSAGDARASRRR